jgi:hypothetical protein
MIRFPRDVGVALERIKLKINSLDSAYCKPNVTLPNALALYGEKFLTHVSRHRLDYQALLSAATDSSIYLQLPSPLFLETVIYTHILKIHHAPVTRVALFVI